MRITKAMMRAALAKGAEAAERGDSWFNVVLGAPGGEDAYQRYMVPLAPKAADDGPADNDSYSTTDDQCMWLCASIGALDASFDLRDLMLRLSGSNT